jgi:hypothetical protein
MPFDFRTRSLRVNRIINSGSTSTSPLLIYGLGSITDTEGGFTVSHFTTGSDTWLFVSGSARSRGTTTRGVVTFGGDIVTSGSLYAVNGLTGSLTKLVNGTDYLRAGSNVTLTTGSDGSVTIASTGGGGASNWNELSPSPRLNSTASVAIAGALGSSYAAQSAGADVFFFVSGTQNTTGVTARKSVFGGDVHISGSLNQGNQNVATGQYSHAEGRSNDATGDYSHAEGRSNDATGDYSHAEGFNNVASGEGSHSEGNNSNATGIYSHAEGDATDATAYAAHSEGFETLASNSYAHAEGYQTAAVAVASHAGGLGTIASGSYQTVYGKYNLRNNTTSLFVVGDGSGTSNAARHDIVRVESGSFQITGSLIVSDGNITGSNLALSGDLAVNGGDITTAATTFNVASTATTLNLGSSSGKVVVPGDFEVQGTTVTVDVSNITVEDPLISLGFTTGSVAGSAGDRGFIGGITGAGNNVAFAWSNNSGSFVATRTTSTAGATSVVVGGLQPIRASSFQVNGTTAVITSSDGSTLTLSGTAIVLNASGSGKVSFREDNSEYLQFSRNFFNSSALIRSTEATFPSLYLSGNEVHLDSYNGLTWFGSNSVERLAVDHTNSSNPTIVSRFPTGQSVNLTISGSNLVLGSNSGQTYFYRGASEYLRATYNGASDTVISAQALNLNVGGAASTQVSGSTVILNHGAGTISFQRHGSQFASFSSGSGNVASLVAVTGKDLVVGGDSLTMISGSIVRLNAGASGISFQRSDTSFLTVSAVSGDTILSASNQIALRPTTGVTQVTGTLEITSNVTASNLRLSGDIQLNGGDIQSTAGAVNLFTQTGFVTDVNIGGYSNRNMTLMAEADVSSVTFSLARYRAGKVDVYLATGPTNAEIKNIDIGTGALASGVTYINLGSSTANSYGRTLINTTLTDLKGLLTVTGSTGFGISSANEHRFKGSVIVSGSITGSLTKLFDGTDYLRAGSNVTLTTGSDGSVTIASTGGSGSPAGSNTQVQFNADGAFAATSGLTFATGSSSLTISGDLAVNGGDITTTESTATIFSTNVSSLSLANVASTVTVGGSSSGTAFTLNVAANRTGNSTLNLGTGATSTGNTKNVNIGQGGDPGSTTNIRLGTTDTNATANIYMSGSVYVTGSIGMKGSIIPDATATYTLGTETLRWAHVYTGDLHLRNERGDWTVIEEADFLRIVNNRTGKNFKMMMQPIDD